MPARPARPRERVVRPSAVCVRFAKPADTRDRPRFDHRFFTRIAWYGLAALAIWAAQEVAFTGARGSVVSDAQAEWIDGLRAR